MSKSITKTNNGLTVMNKCAIFEHNLTGIVNRTEKREIQFLTENSKSKADVKRQWRNFSNILNTVHDCIDSCIDNDELNVRTNMENAELMFNDVMVQFVRELVFNNPKIYPDAEKYFDLIILHLDVKAQIKDRITKLLRKSK